MDADLYMSWWNGSTDFLPPALTAVSEQFTRNPRNEDVFETARNLAREISYIQPPFGSARCPQSSEYHVRGEKDVGYQTYTSFGHHNSQIRTNKCEALFF